MNDSIAKVPVKATITFGEVWQAFRDEGLLCDSPVMDSVLHRCATDDRQSSKNGWYVYHSLDNGRAAVLVLADWRHGGYTKYRVTDDTGMTSRDWRKKYGQKEKAAEEAAKKAEAERYEKARQKAQSIWDSGKPCPESFPYLVRKQISLPTLRLSASGQMMVPVLDAMGNIQSLQFIAPQKVNGRDKTFLSGGKMQGGHYSIGASQTDKEKSNVLLIGEGLATVCSACLATGYAGEVCFNCGNLKQVVTDLYTKFPDKKLVILEDNDRHNELTVGNAGVEHAYEAATTVNAYIAHVPADEGQGRDFNDLYCQEGAEAVRMAIETAVTAESASATWEPNKQWLKVKKQGKSAVSTATPQAVPAPASAPAQPQAVATPAVSTGTPAQSGAPQAQPDYIPSDWRSHLDENFGVDMPTEEELLEDYNSDLAKWTGKILKSNCDKIRQAQEGQRRKELNRWAYSSYMFVPHMLAEETVTEALFAAGTATGLSQDEVSKTLFYAKKGMTKPKEFPEWYKVAMESIFADRDDVPASLAQPVAHILSALGIEYQVRQDTVSPATAQDVAPAPVQVDDVSGQDVAPAPAPATAQTETVSTQPTFPTAQEWAKAVASTQAPSAGVAQDVAGQEPAQTAQPQPAEPAQTAQPDDSGQAVETAPAPVQEPVQTYSPTGKGNVVYQPQAPVQVAMDTALPTAQDVAQPQEPVQTAPAQPQVPAPAQPQSAGVADDTGTGAQPQVDDVPFPELDEVPDCDIASLPWTKKEKDWLKDKVGYVLADVCRDIASHRQDREPDRIELIKKGACRVLPLANYAETGTAGKLVASEKVKTQLVQAGVDTGLTADRIEAVIEQLDASGKLETSFDYVAEHRQQREESWLYADVTAKQWDEKSTDEKLEFVARKRKLKNGDYVPRGFFLHPVYGIQKADGKSGYFESIANRPLSVLAKGCDTDSGNWGYTLSWQDDNRKEHKFFVENSRLTGGVPQKNACTAELGKGDYCVDSAFTGAFAKFVTNYQTTHRCHVTFTGGWLETDGRHAFVMPSRSITQDCMPPVYLLPQDGNDPFVTAGKLEDWRNTIGKWSVGNSRMVTALCLAFSGHILPLLNAESIGIHFWGDSSKGKSTLTYVASSVMGKSSDCIQTWDTTKNAPEILATKHNNSLLCLDEVNMADKGVLEKALYKLGNGKGKSRATRTGGLQAQRSWQVCILSTGEHSNEQKISHEKEDVMAGQLVRILDIQAVASADNGVFDVVPAQFEGAREFAEKIKEVSETFYGTARDAFCQYIADNWDTARQELVQFRDTAIAKMQERYSRQSLAGQTGRVLAKMAVLAAAGELAAKLNIVPWAAGYATQVIADTDGMFDQWIFERGGTGQKEEKQTCNFFSQYIQLHPRDFETLSDGTVPTEKPLKRMGFRELDEYGRAVYIFPTDLFKQMCQEGGLKDPKTCAKHLADNGYLQKAPNGSFSGWRKYLPDLGQKRCRVLQLPDDEEPQTQPAETATATQREFLKELVGSGSTGMSGAPADTSAVAGAPATAETVATPAQPQVTAQPAVSMQSAPAPVPPQEPQPAAPVQSAVTPQAQPAQEPAQPATAGQVTSSAQTAPAPAPAPVPAQPQVTASGQHSKPQSQSGALSCWHSTPHPQTEKEILAEACIQWEKLNTNLSAKAGTVPHLNGRGLEVLKDMGGYEAAMQWSYLDRRDFKGQEFVDRYARTGKFSPAVQDVPAHRNEGLLSDDDLAELAAEVWAG